MILVRYRSLGPLPHLFAIAFAIATVGVASFALVRMRSTPVAVVAGATRVMDLRPGTADEAYLRIATQSFMVSYHNWNEYSRDAAMARSRQWLADELRQPFDISERSRWELLKSVGRSESYAIKAISIEDRKDGHWLVTVEGTLSRFYGRFNASITSLRTIILFRQAELSSSRTLAVEILAIRDGETPVVPPVLSATTTATL